MRHKSEKQQWLETISYQRRLNRNEQAELSKLQKLSGEVRMDEKTQRFLAEKLIILDDLTLKYQKTVVQIDKIILAGNTVYVIDMKNYYGAYTFSQNNWY
ncbi:MAG TPA: nuclease-related domain-containing protein [Tetragenococcus sp.]|nr:nuclease-related domain-containing protein [Tetragenococcus sp.]